MATSWFADRQMGPTLLQFGTPEQQARFIPQILDGTSAWSIGMSEPDAGSDVASIRTRAVRDGDHLVANGQKIWYSGPKSAGWIYLLAGPDRDDRPHTGMPGLIHATHSPGTTTKPHTAMHGNEPH